MSDERYISVIGLGRVGLPLALCFAERGLRVLGVDHDPAVLASIRAGQMPFNEAGTQALLDRVQRSGRLELTDRAADAAQADDIVITIGTPSFSHVESDLRQVRAAVDDLLPLLRPGHSLILRSTIAPGTTEFVAGYLEKRRGLRVGEDVFVAHAPERIAAGRFLEEISTLPCIIGGVCERVDRTRREPVQRVRRTDRAHDAGAGRAGEDLDQHPALRDVRAPQPADDGLRELRRERVRGDRADQPRLPARRDRDAGADRRQLPAQGLRVLGGALKRARDAAGRLAGQRGRAAVPGRGGQAADRQPRVAQGRGPRPDVQARHRRRARLAVAEADPAARARARRRRRLRPARGHADAAAARRGPRRRRRDRRDQPLGVRAARDAEGDPRTGIRRLPAGRPVEQPRDRPGVRLRGRGRRRCWTTRPLSTPRPTRRIDAPGARDGRRRDDRHRGRPAAAARSGLGSPRLRPPPGARVDARGLPARRPATCATSRSPARRSTAART